MHFFPCLFTEQKCTNQQLCENPGQVGRLRGEQPFTLETSNRSGHTFPKPEGAENEVDISLDLGVEVDGTHPKGQRDGKW